MANTAPKRAKRVHSWNTRNKTAKLGHHLSAALVDGEITAFDHSREDGPRGDVENVDAQIRGESKVGDNNHPLRLGINQLGEYQYEEAHASNWRYYYCLISYNNREWKKKAQRYSHRVRGRVFSPLARLKTAAEKFAFVTSKIDGVFLLDLSVIAAARYLYMIKRGAHLNLEEEESILLRRSDIYDLCLNPRDTLPRIGMNPRGWSARRYKEVKVSFSVEGKMLFASFPLFTLLDHELQERLSPVLERRVPDIF